jgi:phosphohistidine phosphatase
MESPVAEEERRMEVCLVRHGEAVAELIDPRRPLTGVGRHNVNRVARLAATKALPVSIIYHSGILRALETAEIIARYLAPSDGIGVMPGLLPEDDPVVAAAALASAAKPTMLVGHLPHLNRLAALLSAGQVDGEMIEFMPATLACYSREGLRWKLNWTMTP